MKSIAESPILNHNCPLTRFSVSLFTKYRGPCHHRVGQVRLGLAEAGLQGIAQGHEFVDSWDDAELPLEH
jgi:hypothetical protein